MNIYVGNLSYKSAEKELRELFEEHGSVSNVSLITDRNTGKSKGFGFVEMDNDEEGRKAIKALDGADLSGRNLRVNEARPKRED